MKHILLLLFILTPLVSMAQENTVSNDTTLYVNGRKIVIKDQGDKIKVKLYEQSSKGNVIANEQIFEGVYLNGQISENRTLLNGLPFVKKKQKRNLFVPHTSGLYIGYTQMSNDFFSFNPSDRIELVPSHAWEFGFNLFDNHIAFGATKNWGVAISVGWGYRTMRLEGNNVLLKIDGVTGIYPGAADAPEYNKSRLRYLFFRIPLSLEWQTRLNGRGPLFFAIGPEAEIRHGIRSKTKIDGDAETLGRGMNVRPLGINLLTQVGYGDFGVYMRYSTYGLFEKSKGPVVYPFSFGLCWYYR